MSEVVKLTVSQLVDRQAPSQDLIKQSFDEILSGNVDPILISAFLVGLRIKGESVDDIHAAVSVMREHSTKVRAPDDVVDTCGTGGLPFKTLNTSTASAIVTAGAGGRVAKHGNRSTPPKTGSADVLETLGVRLDISPEQFDECLKHARVGFMFARQHHTAMRHVAPVRQALSTRTIFNVLGPLTNPANAKYQVLGVFSKEWLNPLAQVLQRLGTKKAWIVHGEDGLDEISITGTTHAIEITPTTITPFSIHPDDVGLKTSSFDELKGGNSLENADAIRRLLEGEKFAFRDVVAMNAGAALYVSQKAKTHKEGVEMALESIDSGRALDTLNALIKYSNKDS